MLDATILRNLQVTETLTRVIKFQGFMTLLSLTDFVGGHYSWGLVPVPCFGKDTVLEVKGTNRKK